MNSSLSRRGGRARIRVRTCAEGSVYTLSFFRWPSLPWGARRASRIRIGSPLPDGGFSGGSSAGGGFQGGTRVTGAGVWKLSKRSCPSDGECLGGEFPHRRGDGGTDNVRCWGSGGGKRILGRDASRASMKRGHHHNLINRSARRKFLFRGIYQSKDALLTGSAN